MKRSCIAVHSQRMRAITINVGANPRKSIIDLCLLQYFTLFSNGTKMNSAVYLVCVVFCIVEYQCTKSDAVELSQRLLDAIRYVESGGDVCALGDSTSGMMSLGAYHITQDYYNDAVEANVTLTAYGEGMTRICNLRDSTVANSPNHVHAAHLKLLNTIYTCQDGIWHSTMILSPD